MAHKALQERVRLLDAKLNQVAKVLRDGSGSFIDLVTKKDLAGEVDSLNERLAGIQDSLDGIASKLEQIRMQSTDTNEARASSKMSRAGHHLLTRTRTKRSSVG